VPTLQENKETPERNSKIIEKGDKKGNMTCSPSFLSPAHPLHSTG